MTQNSFFDTNVILNYGKFTKNTKSEIIKKCYEYIRDKKGKFIICYFLEQEIKKVINKNKIMHKEIIEKIKNESYEIGSSIESGILKSKDIANTRRLYELKKNISLNILSNAFLEDEIYLEMNIEHFLKAKVDEKVIPIDQIDINLVKKLNDYIDNYADCNMLASALQFQKYKEIFLFVSVDNKDFGSNGYDFLKEQFQIDYPKEDYKFPELLMLSG